MTRSEDRLAEMVAKWEKNPTGDYEIRKLIRAYREDVLDAGGLALLTEELEDIYSV